ncbi:hypothetical protein [Lysinibacter sp. HNR]|uniref:hypothetical protein n=1 Tax=Lysinibacter sp. HNR TaxID=3031408 RepID=UPI002435CBED|nr:hypothetical protein [Lysinibacter sp. HNR]WGD37108.1 hypothetical protein FrondiHNR_11810 [Lysinibacter sp. HNR]
MRKFIFASTGTAAVIALLLTGCSGDTNSAKDTADSPLTPYFEKIFGDSDTAENKQREKKVEDAIASCMADEGFDYTPQVRDSSMDAENASFFEGRGTLEWAEKNGFGISTGPMMEERAEGNSSNPNEEYIASLSEGEQTAYNTALYGNYALPSGDENDSDSEEGNSTDDAVYEYDPEKAGCAGSAQHKVDQELGDPTTDPEYKELFEAMTSGLFEKVDAEPKVVAASKEWGACMADAGHPGLEELHQVQQLIFDRLPQTGPSDGDDTLEQSAQKEETKDYEIKLAVADHKCQEKTQAEKIRSEAKFVLEKEFIAKNTAKLDALVSTYGKK